MPASLKDKYFGASTTPTTASTKTPAAPKTSPTKSAIYDKYFGPKPAGPKLVPGIEPQVAAGPKLVPGIEPQVAYGPKVREDYKPPVVIQATVPFGGMDLDKTFTSASSTLAVPNPEMIQKAEKITGAVSGKLKEWEGAKGGDDKGVRKTIATGINSTVRMFEDIGSKQNKLYESLTGRKGNGLTPTAPASREQIAREALDYAVALSNIPAPIIETGIAGLKSTPGLGSLAGNTVEGGFAKLSGVAQRLTEGGIDIAKQMGIEVTPEWEKTVTDVGVNTLLWAAFAGVAKGSGKIKSVGEMRSSADMVKPMHQQLGIDSNKSLLGEVKKVDDAQLRTAYKNTLDRIASEGGPDVAVKMDIADTAYRMAKDYNDMGPAGFSAKWDPLFEQAKIAGEQLNAKAMQKMDDVEVQTKAQAVAEAIHKPASSKTVREVRKFDPDMQLAFESELVRIGDEKFPSIQERAAKDGVAVRNIMDKADTRPAHYDIETGELRFNDAAINETMRGLAEGKILRIGEGKQTRVFRMRDGESIGSAKQRLMDAMYDHEVAHIKTITPDDIAQMRAAKATGDMTKFNDIRKDLEQRAETFRFEKGREISQEQFAALDESLARTQNLEDVRSSLRELEFKNKAQEASYQDWRKTRTEPNADYQVRFDKEVALRKQLGEAKAAYQKATPDAIRGAIERTVAREKGKLSVERAKLGDKADVKTRKLEVKLLRERILRRLEKQNVKESFEGKKQAIVEKFGKKGEAQQIIKDYMVENRVPKEVRGGFIAQLKNAKNASDAARVIDSIREQYSKYERKEARTRIVKLIERTKVERQASGLNKGKFTAETQRKLDQIKKLMKEDRQIMMGSVMKEVDQFWKDNPDALELPDALAAKLELAEMSGLKSQTVAQLQNTEANIRGLMEEGKTERQMKMEERRRVDDNFIRNANEQSLGRTEKPLETQADIKVMQKAINESVARGWWNSSQPLGILVRRLGKAVGQLASETIGAVDRAAGRLADAGKKLEAKLESTYGKRWNDTVHEMATKQFDLGDMTDANGNTVRVRTTKMQAMDLYNALLDKDKAAALLNKDGNGYSQGMVDAMLGVLDEGDKKMADYIRESYKEIYPEMQKVFEERTGVPLGNVENYSGHARWEGMAERFAEMNPLESVLKDADNRRLSTSPIAVKTRSGFSGKLKLSDNPFADLMQYRQKVGHYIETAEQAARWRKLVSDSTFRDGILKKYGKEYLEGLDYHVANIERGGADLKKMSRLQKGFYELSQQVSGALIANPRVWMGQLSSLPQFTGETVRLGGSKGAWLRGARKVKANAALLDKYVPTLKARYADAPAEIVARFGADRSKFRRGLEKFKKGQGSITEAFDKFTTMRGASGMFESMTEFYQSKGHDLNRAYELAGQDVARMVADTQSTKSFLGKSRLETQTSWIQPMTALQNQPNKIAHSMVQAIADVKTGKLTKAKAAEYLVWTGVIQPAMYYSLRAGTTVAMTSALYAFLKGIGADEEAEKVRAKAEKKRQEESVAQGIAGAMFSNATGFLVAGDAIMTAQNNLIGGKNYELRPSLSDVAVDDILGAIEQWNAGDIDEAAALSIRSISRANGIGDPLGLINAYLASASEKNKTRKAEEKKEASKNRTMAEKIADSKARKEKARAKKEAERKKATK